MEGHDERVEKMRRGRGDMFWETEELARFAPSMLDLQVAPYVHAYEGAPSIENGLSAQFRELIAICLLLKEHEPRLTANHVRKLYRLGVTDDIIMDAVFCASPYFGGSLCIAAIQALGMAKDVANREGALPAGGAPTECTPFPELELGDGAPAGTPREQVWATVEKIDPTLARLAREDYELVQGGGGQGIPYAAREVIAFVVVCHRGVVDFAVEHARRALAAGVTPAQLLQAASTSVPMSGLMTLEIGALALDRAQGDEHPTS